MTVFEAIRQTDTRLYNDFSDDLKIKWLSDLDGQIKRNIIDTHEGAVSTNDGEYTTDTTLLVDEPYSELYVLYLIWQIYLSRGEIDQGNNALAAYNTLYYEWAKYYNRTHLPIHKGNIRRYRFEV